VQEDGVWQAGALYDGVRHRPPGGVGAGP